MTGCSSTPLSLSFWHTECDAPRRCPRILSFFSPQPLCFYLTKKHTVSMTRMNFLLKTFLTRTYTSYAFAPIKTVHIVISTASPHSFRAYINVEIFIYIHFPSSFFLGRVSKRNIFLHFRICYIYEECRKCPQGNTVTHLRVLQQ